MSPLLRPRRRLYLTCLWLAGALCPEVMAQRGQPGSLLLFPEYDTSRGVVQLITVTNALREPSPSVSTRWSYTEGATCTSARYDETLASNDTLTVMASVHHQTPGRGYLHVYAQTSAGEPIVHNQLIGTSTRVDAFSHRTYTIEPLSFRALGPAGSTTDHNGDGRRDLNDVEYQATAAESIFPRFLGQGVGFSSQLILVDLTGGRNDTTEIELRFFNDSGVPHTATRQLRCWSRVDLAAITNFTTNDFLLNSTVHDPLEIIGLPILKSGWFKLWGKQTFLNSGGVLQDPAIAAVLIGNHEAGGSMSMHPAFQGMNRNGGLGVMTNSSQSGSTH